MAKFKVGVEVEQTLWTVVIAEVEADTKEEAERKAVGAVGTICQKAKDKSELGIDQFQEWDDEGCFVCCGVNHDEDWNSEEENYEPNIKV